jgi:uncharacterized protein
MWAMGGGMKTFGFDQCKTWMGRLERGDDILEELTGFCRREGIRSASISAIGAVERGGVGYFDQDKKEYRVVRFDKAMEIAALSGNVSIREGEVFLHCHVILAGPDGKCFGGHLVEENIAFACEFVITALEGEQAPERTAEEKTGLMLW